MGFALIIGHDSESKKVMDCIRPRRELSFLAQGRDSISYKPIMPYILKHLATSTDISSGKAAISVQLPLTKLTEFADD